jgi:hypothetical protein
MGDFGSPRWFSNFHVPASRRDSSSSVIAISHRSRLGEAREDLRDGESD